MTNPSEVMYHAQCPHCATIRKISLLQLQEHKGLVPCRRCEQSYPARGHLLSREQLEQLMSQANIKNQTEIPSEQIILAVSAAQTPSATQAANTTQSNNTPKPVVMEHVFVGVINDEEPEPEKPAKSMGLLAKLLSRKNTQQSTQAAVEPGTNSSDIVFETELDSNTPNGFAESKAKLHVDDVKAQTNEPPPAIAETDILDDFDVSALDLSHTDGLQSTKPSKKNHQPAANTLLQAADHNHSLDDDAHVIEIDPQNSRIDALLVREASQNPTRSLQETEVLAPEYDANRQWFTEMFQTMQAHNTPVQTTAPEATAKEADATDEELIPTAKRLNESGNSNTVTMRLPENSMLVFTLEDNGTTQSMLELPRTEPQAHGQTSVIHTVEVTNQQNEHTMWTVANIVAIVVLIIQMFYYFLLLTP